MNSSLSFLSKKEVRPPVSFIETKSYFESKVIFVSKSLCFAKSFHTKFSIVTGLLLFISAIYPNNAALFLSKE
jgi:hypothetical protein